MGRFKFDIIYHFYLSKTLFTLGHFMQIVSGLYPDEILSTCNTSRAACYWEKNYIVILLLLLLLYEFFYSTCHDINNAICASIIGVK